MVWRYFNDTGLPGGTANPSDNTFYVDSYKGSDLNVGSNVAPFQTIQKALDSSAAGGCDIVLAGRFKEGDFLNQRTDIGLIAEGDVYIEPDLATFFRLASGVISFNIDVFAGKVLRDYGRLHFKDFDEVTCGGGNGSLIGIYRSTFKDIGIYVGGNKYFKIVKECIFDGSEFKMQTAGVYPETQAFVENNNFINGGFFNMAYNGLGGGKFRDNYGDSLATIVSSYGNAPNNIFWTFEYNHFERNVASSFWGSYANMDAFEALDGVENNLPYAQSPQFSGLNADDYSLDPSSPNATGGWNNGPIGAFDKGYSTNNVDSGNWTLTNITITGAGAASVANLTAAGVGTLEETVGNQLSATEDVYIGATYFPSLVQDFSVGQVADKTKSADAGTPSIPTLEIGYSLDSTNGVDGIWSAWIEVPIGVVPLEDGAGKGNGDDTFAPSTGAKIPARWVRRRITLRDDEVALP